MSTGSDVERRLAAICGPRFARHAGPADEVAGAPARFVAAPGTVEAVSAVMRLAAEHDLALAPRGAGSKLDWGAPPARLDVLVDTGRLAGVWHRPPGESVVEVGAGTPVRAVQAALGRDGLRLPLDPPSAGATIGGVVAADESGPLRHRHGTPCEQLVGVSYVDAEGRLRHSEGWGDARPRRARPQPAAVRVAGSAGVLVSATMRVQPAPLGRLWVLGPCGRRWRCTTWSGW